MKRIITLLAAIATFMVMSANVFAQGGYVVKGVVSDSEGPIIGATVMEASTLTGTITDSEGRYTLKVSSADAIIEVSCMGYKTVSFKASEVLPNVILTADSEYLDDVVVIAYGTVKKEDLTGSVSALKADQLNKGVITSPASLLQGKSAGVVITAGDGAPGSGSTIRIRGGSSLKANNNPLIVIDGLPLSEVGIDGVGDALASINPNDIESFSVLKDASATAIYGSRASNGIIIITTKKGSKTGSKLHVDVDYTGSLSQNAKYLDVLKADELRDLVASIYGTDGAAYNALGKANTDWQREIYQLAQTHDANIALSGGVKTKWMSMPWRISYGFHDQAGTLKTSHMGRHTLALNLNPSFLQNHLTLNISARGMAMNHRFADGGAVGAAVKYDPTQEVAPTDQNALNGRFWWNRGLGTATIENCNPMASQNPLALLYDKNDVSKANRLIANALIDYKIHGFEDLKLSLNLGIDMSKSKGTVDVAPGTEQSFHSTSQSGSGYHTNYDSHRVDQTLEFYLNYNKDLGKHNINALAGYSWQHYYHDSFNEQFKADGTNPNDHGYYIQNPKTFKTEYYLVSFFGRLNYNYDNRFHLTATLRNDGTSRFANNKWGLFPSVALSYNFANEIKGQNILSKLALRASWGQTGQQDLQSGDYPTLSSYVYNTNASMYYFGEQLIVPITPKGYNADLKWETTTTYNVGLDFGFFSNRLTFGIDAYQRDTKDLLNRTPVAAGANLSNYLDANIGDLTNRGIEVEVNAVPVETKHWGWTIGFNAAYNKTTITRLTTDDSRAGYYGIETGGISGGTGNNIQVHQAGHAPNSFFVYQQIYDMDGRPIEGAYVDRNNDGIINTDDKYCYMKAAPDWTFGFNTQLSYKRWTLAVSAHSNLGNYIYNNISSDGDLMTDLWTNQFINNRYRTALYNNVNTVAQYFSDMYIQNGSFLKIDNITLSRMFSLGQNYGLNVFATVQNVATFTKYTGIDPEIFSGIDNNMYPRPRTYILGIKFNF